MATQQNAITKQDLSAVLERLEYNQQELKRELKDDMRHNQHTMLLIVGSVLAALIACFIVAVLLIAGVWGDVGELQGLHKGVDNTHAITAK